MSNVMSDDYMPDDIMRVINPRYRRGGLFNMPWGDPTRDPGMSAPAPASAPAAAPPTPEAEANDRLTRMVQGGGVTPDTESPDEAHLRDLHERQDKMQQPLGWKRSMLRAGMMALPVALGAALGGSEGATGAAQGASGFAAEQRKRRFSLESQLNKDIESESHNVTGELRQKRIDAQNVDYRDMQKRNLQSEIDSRDQFHRNQAPPTLTVEDESGGPKVMQYNPESGRYDIPVGKGYQKEGKTTSDEFERLWASDPSHAGKKPTLADKLAYENQLSKGKHQPPEANFSPVFDNSGKITGFYNTHNPGETRDTTGLPQGARKSGIPGAPATRLIQADAINKSYNDIANYVDHHPGLTGPGAGRWNSIRALWGDANPDAQELKGRILSFAAMQPGLHGMRNVQLVNEIEKALGGQKLTAESLKRGLKGMTQAAGQMKDATEGFYGAGGSLSNKVGAVDEEYERGPDGKLRRVK